MPWSPSELILPGDTGGWFNPADYAATWQDVAATVPVTATGQTVARIDTQTGGGAGFSLTQGTASAQPKSHADGIVFDGSDFLDSGLSRFGRCGLYAQAAESWTVAVSIIGWTTSGVLIARGGATTAERTFQLFISNGVQLILRGMQTQLRSTPLAGEPRTFICRWDGSQLRWWDGDVLDGTIPPAGTASQEATQRILVGARTNGTGFFAGAGQRMPRMFFVDRALSDVEIGYLKRRLGESVGLTIGTEPPASSGAHSFGAISSTAPAAVSVAPVGQVHTFSPTAACASEVVVVAPVGQVHGFAPVSACAPAAAGVPNAAQIIVFSPLQAVASAELVVAPAGQVHAFAPIDANASGVAATSAARQVHAFAPIAACANGVVETAPVSQAGALQGVVATAPAVVSVPPVGQVHSFAPLAACAVAAVEVSQVGQVHAFGAIDATASAAVDVSSVGQVHGFAPLSAVAPATVISSPAGHVQAALPPLAEDDYRSRSVSLNFRSRSASVVYSTRAA